MPQPLRRKRNQQIMMKTKIQNLLIVLGLLTINHYCSTASAQNLFVGNNSGSVVEFAPNGAGSVIASNLPSTVFGVACDGAGNIYVSCPSVNTIEKFSPGGIDLGPFATNNLNYPQGLAFDGSGNLYVVNSTNIEEFTPGGAGVNFNSTNLLYTPASLAIDGNGNLYVANDVNSGGSILKITPAGVASVFVANFGSYPSGLACDSAGNLYAARYFSGVIEEYSPDGTDLGPIASITNPTGLAFDTSSNLYVSLITQNKIEKFSPAGTDLGTFTTNNLSAPQQMAFQIIKMPPLTIAPAGNQSVLFWPITATNYVLQSATNLSSPNWVTASDAVPVIAFTVTNASPARFFRLQPQ